uniref:Uncharacterized protein n=1 Tax=Rhizophora mucronata TaxID=61149 RepID=A0A2P2NJF5_RHIMU
MTKYVVEANLIRNVAYQECF